MRPGEDRSAAAERSPSVTAGSQPEGVGRPGEDRSAAAERSPDMAAGALPPPVVTSPGPPIPVGADARSPLWCPPRDRGVPAWLPAG